MLSGSVLGGASMPNWYLRLYALFSYALLSIALSLVSVSFGQTTSARIEETDPSVTFSGDWYKNGSSANSGGSAVLNECHGRSSGDRVHRDRHYVVRCGGSVVWRGQGLPRRHAEHGKYLRFWHSL